MEHLEKLYKLQFYQAEQELNLCRLHARESLLFVFPEAMEISHHFSHTGLNNVLPAMPTVGRDVKCVMFLLNEVVGGKKTNSAGLANTFVF